MLTRAERMMLYNQYEILKILDPDSAKNYEENQEIVSHGFEIFYGELNLAIYENTFSAEDAREVLDILSMFRAIKFSCDRLNYTPKSPWAKFEGFDANEGDGRYSFARFLRRTQGKFVEFADAPDNSHSSGSLGMYRRMLERWNALGEKYDMTEDQIEEVAGRI